VLTTRSRYIISITMAFTYGYETDSLDAPLVKSLAEFVQLLNDGLPPERNAMLSAFPFRTYFCDLVEVCGGLNRPWYSGEYPGLVSWCSVQEGCITVSGAIAEIFGRPL
jgi:hypothetical protein